MAFSEASFDRAWEMAGGRCQCERKTHVHMYGRCTRELVHEKRGVKETGG